MDHEWADSWNRLGAANQTAWRARLSRLTLADALEQFEALCREVHRAFADPQPARTHAVGLSKLWKRKE